MNIITPLILIIISIGTFFAYTDSAYRGQGGTTLSVQELQVENAKYVEALANDDKVRKMRDGFQNAKNNISSSDNEKLMRLLPDNIDNIKLVIDINNIAQNYQLTMKGAKLDTTIKADPNKLGADTSKYGTVGLSFTVTASYSSFHSFLRDLEKSLRLVEVTDLAVTGNNTGLYDFTVGLKTYWLK